jgi:thiamine pyrophosphate-dependent acetolactate synthase large subunit-like protein
VFRVPSAKAADLRRFLRRQAKTNGIDAQTLARMPQLPVAVTGPAKAVIDETFPYYAGVYNGKASDPRTREAIEAADCLLSIGYRPIDGTSGEFTAALPADTIRARGHSVHCLDWDCVNWGQAEEHARRLRRDLGLPRFPTAWRLRAGRRRSVTERPTATSRPDPRASGPYTDPSVPTIIAEKAPAAMAAGAGIPVPGCGRLRASGRSCL